MNAVEEKEFTYIDAINQFWTALEDGERRSLTSAYLTYGHLCHVWNGCGRPVSFRRQNTKICADLCISKPTLDRHRNILKMAGLINFFSKGKGDQNIVYEVKKVYYQEVKKERNFTSPVTSPVTTHEYIKQSKSNEVFVVIGGEVKNLYYLKNLVESDEGLRRRWQDNGFKIEQFSAGFESFMSLKHSSAYPDFHQFRNNFFFWIPNYAQELKKKMQNGQSAIGNQANSYAPRAGKGGSVTSLQSLKKRTDSEATGGVEQYGAEDSDSGAGWQEAEVLK